jgi:putative endonuclease
MVAVFVSADGKYFLYVLWSESARRFYIGISGDPSHRLEHHNTGAFGGWTSKYRPWKLVLTEEYADYTDARQRELDLKAQKGGVGFFKKTGLDPVKSGRGS